MQKSELKINQTTYCLNPDDHFTGKDGQEIRFFSIRRTKFDKDSNKPKFQTLTVSLKDVPQFLAWLKQCLS